MTQIKARILTAIVLVAASGAAARDSAPNGAAIAERDWLQMQMETGFPLSGEYFLVSERRASGVAAPASPRSIAGDAAKSISFGLTLRWIDGRTCSDWLPARWNGIPFDMGDPNLSDVTVGPLGDRADRRSYWLFQIVCEGDILGPLVVVDLTTAIIPSPNGASFAIVSLPATESLMQRIQGRLQQERFYDGEQNGQLDEKTKAAVAAYAEHRGAAYRFASPAMTLNLLEGLGVWDDGTAP